MEKKRRHISGFLVGFGAVAVVAAAAAVATVITIFTGLIITNPGESFANLGAFASLASAVAAAVAAGLSWRAIKQAQEERELEIGAGAPSVVLNVAKFEINMINYAKEGTEYRLSYIMNYKLDMQNIGQRPGTDVRIEFFLFIVDATRQTFLEKAILQKSRPFHKTVCRIPAIPPLGYDTVNDSLRIIQFSYKDKPELFSGAACLAIYYKDPHPFFVRAPNKGNIEKAFYHTWDASNLKKPKLLEFTLAEPSKLNEVKLMQQLISRERVLAGDNP